MENMLVLNRRKCEGKSRVVYGESLLLEKFWFLNFTCLFLYFILKRCMVMYKDV